MSELTYIETVVGCPFCGETPTMKAWNVVGHDTHMVACSNDACPATPAVAGATRAAAIRLWNARKANTQDVLDPDDYDVWFAMLYSLADTCRLLVAAIEQINASCQTREQRAALVVGRAALAALQRLEHAGDTTQGNGEHGASQQCGNSSSQQKPE